jgi:hypothetical protein
MCPNEMVALQNDLARDEQRLHAGALSPPGYPGTGGSGRGGQSLIARYSDGAVSFGGDRTVVQRQLGQNSIPFAATMTARPISGHPRTSTATWSGSAARHSP